MVVDASDKTKNETKSSATTAATSTTNESHKTKTTKPASASISSIIDDDCDRPACDDIISKYKVARARVDMSKKENKPLASGYPEECPPAKSFLGASTWTLLHTMAAWYPDEPTDKDRDHMNNFFQAFARFYPCTWCAKGFTANLQKKPVQTTTRKDLCIWLCEQHNIVNQKLGKPEFKCEMKHLDERWRKSDKEECQNLH